MKTKGMKRFTGLIIALSMIFGAGSAYVVSNSLKQQTIVCYADEEIPEETPAEEENKDETSEEQSSTEEAASSEQQETSTETSNDSSNDEKEESGDDSSTKVTPFSSNDIITLFKIMMNVIKDGFKELFRSLKSLLK